MLREKAYYFPPCHDRATNFGQVRLKPFYFTKVTFTKQPTTEIENMYDTEYYYLYTLRRRQ
jgi:hypothetical protein